MQTTKPSQGQKPGSMTRAMSAVQADTRPRVLRVGLVQNGRIIEERTLKTNESLRVGASEKNGLLVQSEVLGASYLLVQAQGGTYTLRVPKELRGRVSSDGEVHELGGGEGELKLSPQSRGRLQIGGSTILFQFVPEAVQGGRAQLPVAASGGFTRGIDWLFTCFVLASYMGFLGMVVYLENADWELESPNLVPELAARLVFNEPAPPVERLEPEVTPIADTPDDVVDVAQAETTRQTPQRDAERNTSTPSEQTLARNEQIRDAAVSAAHEMLGSLLDDGHSAVNDLINNGAPTDSAGDVLARVAGVDTASRADNLRDRNGGPDGSGTSEGIGQIARRDTDEVRTSPLEETRVRAVATARPPVIDSGHGDVDMQRVASVVRRRMSAIRRCYERELTPHPGLAGKVVVEFTIQQSGSVTNSTAVENLTGSERLGGCLSGVMRTVRLTPGPTGGSVTVRYPFVFALQQ